MEDKKLKLVVFMLSILICLNLCANLVNADSPNYIGQTIGQAAASSIATLPPVQTGGDPCNEVVQMIQNGGTAENYINKNFGTNFEPVSVSSPDCAVLITFLPVVGSYNNLITAAQQYNASNSTSVNNFYVQSFVLAADITIVNGAVYHTAFGATGGLNDALKLGKLKELCGNTCYSDALSSIYWTLKNTGSQELDDFMSWAGGQFSTRQQPNLSPSTIQSQSGASQSGFCSWPILGWLLSLVHAC